VVWQGQFSVVRRQAAEQMACITVEVRETGTVDCAYCLLCDMIQRMFELQLVVVIPSLLKI